MLSIMQLKSMMKTASAWLAATALAGFVQAHVHAEAAETQQEPFVGWTKEDLDAKWGTDVGLHQIHVQFVTDRV